MRSPAPAAARATEVRYGPRNKVRTVLANAEHLAAVNPLLPAAHRYAAEAHEALGEKAGSIQSYRALLQMNPTNPAQVHFRLGRLLHETGGADAKRHVLLALEEAPRFRDALDLLLEMTEEPSTKRGVPKKLTP